MYETIESSTLRPTNAFNLPSFRDLEAKKMNSCGATRAASATCKDGFASPLTYISVVMSILELIVTEKCRIACVQLQACKTANRHRNNSTASVCRQNSSQKTMLEIE